MAHLRPDPSRARQLDTDLAAFRKQRHLFEQRRTVEVCRDRLRFLPQLIVEILNLFPNRINASVAR